METSSIYTNNNNIACKGLTTQCKRAVYSNTTFDALNDVFKSSNGILGNLPSAWINNIPFKLRRDNITGLYKEFGEIIKCLRRELANNTNKNSFSDFVRTNVLKKHQITKNPNHASTYSDEITSVMRKYKAIGKDECINIKYIQSGDFGDGFILINSKDDSKLFLKIFKENANTEDMYGQGIKSEANLNIYLRTNLKSKSDKKYFPKFYFADTKNGYYIEEYISNKNSISINKIAKSKLEELKNEIRSILKKVNLAPSDQLDNNIKIIKGNNGKYFPIMFELGGLISQSKYEELCQHYSILFNHYM